MSSAADDAARAHRGVVVEEYLAAHAEHNNAKARTNMLLAQLPALLAELIPLVEARDVLHRRLDKNCGISRPTSGPQSHRDCRSQHQTQALPRTSWSRCHAAPSPTPSRPALRPHANDRRERLSSWAAAPVNGPGAPRSPAASQRSARPNQREDDRAATPSQRRRTATAATTATYRSHPAYQSRCRTPGVPHRE